MELTKIHLIAAYSIVILLVMAFTLVSGDVLLDEEPGRLAQAEEFQKRVFCNSFSGCFGSNNKRNFRNAKAKKSGTRTWEDERNLMLRRRQPQEEMLEYNR